MTDLERMYVEHACQRLVIAFHIHADRWEHDQMAALFAEDAVFDHIAIGRIEGRKAIRAYFDRKETTSVTRHITTNILIDVIDADHAKGSCYWTFYGSAPGSTVPVLLKGPSSVGGYEDRFVRTHEGWRFAYRRSGGVFAAPHQSDYILLKD